MDLKEYGLDITSFERQSMMMRRATRLMRVVGEWKAVVTSLSSVERRPYSTQHKPTGTIRKSTHHKRTICKGTHRTQSNHPHEEHPSH